MLLCELLLYLSVGDMFTIVSINFITFMLLLLLDVMCHVSRENRLLQRVHDHVQQITGCQDIEWQLFVPKIQSHHYWVAGQVCSQCSNVWED